MADLRLTPAEAALARANAARDPETSAAAFAEARKLGAALKLVARGEAMALSQMGRHEAAVAAYRPWAERNPRDPGAQNTYGVLLKRAGRLRQAIVTLEQARKLAPSDLAAWQNLGNVHEALGQAAKAEACFRGALKIAPKSAELWRLLARQQMVQDDFEGALSSLDRALLLAPGEPVLLSLYAHGLVQANRADEAEALLERLVAKAPQDAELRVMQARVAFRLGQVPKALAILRQVLVQQPDHLNANLQLSILLGDGDREGANAALTRAVEAHPANHDALERLVESLSRSRHGVEADHIEAAYARAKELMARFPHRIPDAARILRTILMRVLDEDRMAQTGELATLLTQWQRATHSSVHYELGQVGSLEDRLALVEWHRAWGRRVSARITPLAAPPRLSGKLRVGFMSSDLRHHPITYFALPLLEGHDRDRVEVFCYSFSEKAPDRVQDHLARQTTFRHWPRRPDAQVAEGIAADGLDMLFELGGSTAMNKLEVMAYKPARLGASWLGYPHSAGLSQIDYILTDPYLRPADPRLLIEKPFEMPQTWVALSRLFAPHEIAPGTPEARKGHLTFGTANNPYKYTPACLDAWAMVLRTVPGSRFAFLRPEAAAPSFIAGARAAFARRDVDPDRLDFIGVRGDHMRHYNEIDIALDTLPHVGGTTTCEALWMGVPTVSLVGPGMPERLSYSNLSNAGLGDLAVFSRAEYVGKAAELAADPALRLALRQGMRARIAAHPLGQPEDFTRAFFAKVAEVCA